MFVSAQRPRRWRRAARLNRYLVGLAALMTLVTATATYPAAAADGHRLAPTLAFSTFLGTAREEGINAVVVDAAGHIIVGGWTDAVDFPTTPDAFQPTSTGGTCFSPPPFNIPFPCNDGFIAKFSADGATLLYSTYFGGTGDDGVRSLALDDAGNIYVTGWTTSLDFPTMNPIQPDNGGGGNRTPDSFVARFTPDGAALDYSTYLGGSGRDYGDNIAVDAQGNAYVVGWSESTNFPVANAVQPTYGGGFFDGVVTRVNAAGDAFTYSTYLGGDDLEYAFGVDVDKDGSAFITGFTLSADFPTFNALQPTFGGGIEAYVTKLSSDGTAYVYSTYFGNNDTRGYDIRVHSDGYAYLVGATSSTTFPTVNPLQAEYSGALMDGFVSRFVPDGSAVDFSTYLGGDGNDVLHTLTLDSAANVHFTGWTSSTDFPLVDPVQATPGGGSDALVGTIAADLSALDFGSYVGGASSDFSRAVAVHTDGTIHLAGTTVSADFPTADPFQPTLAGGTDGFVLKIREGPTLPGDSLYVSLDAADTLGGLVVTSADIAVFDVNAATWALHFDGAAAGIGAADIDAFLLYPGGRIVMSFAEPVTVPDIGVVDDSDLVLFDPAAGAFTFAFDGSDVGLETDDEDVDGIAIVAGQLAVTTRGAFDVAGVAGEDEDLIVLQNGSFGADTSGEWALLFDGSDVGLGNDASRDVDAVWFDVAGGALYLSSAGAFTLLDFDIAPADVARCVVVTTGPDTTCNPAASGLVWRGADAGVTANVNAIEVGSATGDRLLIPALDALLP